MFLRPSNFARRTSMSSNSTPLNARSITHSAAGGAGSNVGERAAAKMKTIDSRIRRLEDRFSPGNGKPQLLLVACKAGWGLALDQDTEAIPWLDVAGQC